MNRRVLVNQIDVAKQIISVLHSGFDALAYGEGVTKEQGRLLADAAKICRGVNERFYELRIRAVEAPDGGEVEQETSKEEGG